MHNVDNRCIHVDRVLQVWYINVHTICLFFNSECFKEKAFTAYITAIAGIKLIPMQRAYNVTERIDVAISEDSPRMRTFMCTGNKLSVAYTNSDCFPGRRTNRQAIGRKVYFCNTLRYFIPGRLVSLFNDLSVYGDWW